MIFPSPSVTVLRRLAPSRLWYVKLIAEFTLLEVPPRVVMDANRLVVPWYV